VQEKILKKYSTKLDSKKRKTILDANAVEISIKTLKMSDKANGGFFKRNEKKKVECKSR